MVLVQVVPLDAQWPSTQTEPVAHGGLQVLSFPSPPWGPTVPPHIPSSPHVTPSAHVPHVPPHPSLPHCLFPQFALQLPPPEFLSKAKITSNMAASTARPMPTYISIFLLIIFIYVKSIIRQKSLGDWPRMLRKREACGLTSIVNPFKVLTTRYRATTTKANWPAVVGFCPP